MFPGTVQEAITILEVANDYTMVDLDPIAHCFVDDDLRDGMIAFFPKFVAGNACENTWDLTHGVTVKEVKESLLAAGYTPRP